MTSVVTPSSSLTPQARQEAGRALVALGLYPQAQTLLRTDQAEDTELGMLASVLAGDPRTAARFLGRRMSASATRPGEVDLIRGCIALVSGHAEGLGVAQAGLEQMQPTGQDRGLFAVAAAPHDLGAAAQAAALVDVALGPAVPAVQAAARAAAGDVRGAYTLLEAVHWNGVGDDPTRRTGELLKTHGLEQVLQDLEAVRWQRRSFGEALGRRMTGWRARRDERDLRCRCTRTPTLVGENSRHYVNWHLELEAKVEDAKGWRILVCHRSGVRYLDRSSIPVSVAISSINPVG